MGLFPVTESATVLVDRDDSEVRSLHQRKTPEALQWQWISSCECAIRRTDGTGIDSPHPAGNGDVLGSGYGCTPFRVNIPAARTFSTLAATANSILVARLLESQ